MAGAEKFVYRFGAGKADGSAEMRNLLGGKGANLAEMANLGLPVPPGFTITTEVCNTYYAAGKKMPQGLKEQVEDFGLLYRQDCRRWIWRPPKPASCFRALGQSRFDAGHDGHHPQPRPQ